MKENQNDQRNQDKTGNQSKLKTSPDGTKKETNPNTPTAGQEKKNTSLGSQQDNKTSLSNNKENTKPQDTVGKAKPNRN